MKLAIYGTKFVLRILEPGLVYECMYMYVCMYVCIYYIRYICDPVLGDEGVLYVDSALVEIFRTRIIPL